MSDLLQKFARLCREGERNYRDTLLEAGRVAQQHVLARHVPHTATRSDKYRRPRYKNGAARSAAIDELAMAAGHTYKHVLRLVRTAAAADLLGEVGDLSWAVLREFGSAAVRDMHERWLLKPATAQAMLALYQEAARERLAAATVRHRVAVIRGRREPTGQKGAHTASTPDGPWEDAAEPKAAAGGRPRKYTAGASQTAAPPLKAMAEAGTPRDVADMCVELVRASKKPEVVALAVVKELERLGLLRGAFA